MASRAFRHKFINGGTPGGLHTELFNQNRRPHRPQRKSWNRLHWLSSCFGRTTGSARVYQAGRGLVEIAARPEVIVHWRDSLAVHGDWTALLLASALIFPKLALGMSGFETGVSVMPLVSGGAEEDAAAPRMRIFATRKLLAAAALIMSVMLLASSFVTLLIAWPSVRHQQVLPNGLPVVAGQLTNR